jgi:hypothetical protein
MKSGAAVFVAAVSVAGICLGAAFAFGLPLPFPFPFAVGACLGSGFFFDTPDDDFLAGAFLAGAFLVRAMLRSKITAINRWFVK